MSSYMARQFVFFYPLSVAAMFFAAVYFIIVGRWAALAAVVIVATLSWFQYLFVKGWIRSGEDNDVREWLQDNPDYEPGDPGSAQD